MFGINLSLSPTLRSVVCRQPRNGLLRRRSRWFRLVRKVTCVNGSESQNVGGTFWRPRTDRRAAAQCCRCQHVSSSLRQLISQEPICFSTTAEIFLYSLRFRSQRPELKYLSLHAFVSPARLVKTPPAGMQRILAAPSMQAACMYHRLDLCKRSGTHMTISSSNLPPSFPSPSPARPPSPHRIQPASRPSESPHT